MNILGYAQKLGKALMLPIATLPVAALLLRLGQPDLLDIAFMAQAGNAIFSNLPLLFGLGIAIGLSKDGSGAAGLAGAVAYFVLTATATTIDASVNMSFFGGIFAGIIAGHSYNAFHATRLPEWLAFFAGKRLVPIMAGLFAVVAGAISGVVWPTIQGGLDTLAHAVSTSGAIGQFVYGTLNRALIPVGLHHVLNSYFWFGMGTCQEVLVTGAQAAGQALPSLQQLCVDPSIAKTLIAGQTHTFEFANSVTPEITATVKEVTETIKSGDLNRFFGGDKSAGVFMNGFFPVMMFGLPGAALAMYLAAPAEKRSQVGGALFSVGFCSFLTGITEPLEFMFVFLAPALYAIHAVFTGLSLVVANMFGTLHGFGFSAGLIDFILNWGLATKPFTLLLIGLGFGALYFFTFTFAIRAFDLKSPGREDDDTEVAATASGDAGKGDLARQYLKALGGHENLTTIDACITRLRLTLKDRSVANEDVLKKLGAKGVVKLGENNLQVILGPLAEIVAGEMKAIGVNEDLSDVKLP
ncbi:N-acetylglucosamine-specific PTS transporter subunit IIBC [Vibrio coralliilyticus]|uniref:PTS N-acetylmuramic acid transporter subunit IIBC n=1 Tax=Vibrio coralliilyticus TaxID=190893 RepID=A0AAJ3C776_9VIBR|nr:N-acetylglucosamine-specific PTS transporter subunit IIBC [Vibrio coralliilyticus]AIW18089.1 PTS N-acetylmuramic acid transporter subunit IIBC [Vibrio coralliilyticus]ERB65247.1 PTS N-acetylmuramic acid transporter subunit IIBC [Vibrio coralliilyticus OCN008]NOH37231.1 PTS N-acetylmuramic acid transporter subunit IIBC [Vibrio coralliilyticus]NOI76698.1 PTS N-acetylmuramic acid transporter subunit IIBC [Vibrio coralliilyticus]PAW03418.1 PTS N-acetylmuramic acid transporter subunit IIBC [Vibr